MRSRIILGIIIIGLLTANVACPKPDGPTPPDPKPTPTGDFKTGNVKELAESFQKAGLGQTGSKEPMSLTLANVQADEGIVLTGNSLEVEIYKYSDDTKVTAARAGANSEGNNQGTLAWGKFLIIIRTEPSAGHVRRALEVIQRG